MKTKVEAQGGELILRNQNGDTIIIPKNRRKEAMKALLKEDHKYIDSIASQLPTAASYADEGRLISQEDPGKGLLRPDGTKKGKGFYGNLPNKNGDISSEISISSSDVEDGKEVLIPTLIPGLSKIEIDHLLSNKYNPQSREGIDDEISRKAIDFARKRKQQGLPYFAHEIEEGAFKYSDENTVSKGQNPAIKGMMGPEVTITANKKKNSSSFWDFNNHPATQIAKMIDPTGISSYPDVYKAWNDGRFNSDDIVETIGALPVIGEVGKAIKLSKNVSKYSKYLSTLDKIGKKASEIEKVLPNTMKSIGSINNTMSRKSPIYKGIAETGKGIEDLTNYLSKNGTDILEKTFNAGQGFTTKAISKEDKINAIVHTLNIGNLTADMTGVISSFIDNYENNNKKEKSIKKVSKGPYTKLGK